MLALHVHFLTGRYVATAHDDRSRAEWPPHPARLYSALVDALHATDSVPGPQVDALDWLARLDPPRILCGEGRPRRVMTHFVPVNDQAVTDGALLPRKELAVVAALRVLDQTPDTDPRAHARAAKKVDRAKRALIEAAQKEASGGGGKAEAGRQALPWGRTRQPRTFPSLTPTEDVATFLWPDQPPRAHLDALRQVAGRVTRLGHSSSMVLVHVEDLSRLPEDGRLQWVPDRSGGAVLRVPAPGQREELDAAFEHHLGDMPGRVLPAARARYAVWRAPAAVGTTQRSGGRWVTYALDADAQPPGRATVALAAAVRRAFLHHAGDEAPAMLTGHEGAAAANFAHLAYLPLPFVRHPRADGVLRGFALSLPRTATLGEEAAFLRALAHFEAAGDIDQRAVRIPRGSGSAEARRVVDPAASLRSLDLAWWEGFVSPSADGGPRAAATWATATPIALDGRCDPFRHHRQSVRRKARRTATRLIRKALCREITPPAGVDLEARDIEVELVFDVPVAGAPALRDVPPFQRGGHGVPRRLVHAVIRLPFPIQGPLVLGAGSHFGLGLCVPLRDLLEC